MEVCLFVTKIIKDIVGLLQNCGYQIYTDPLTSPLLAHSKSISDSLLAAVLYIESEKGQQ